MRIKSMIIRSSWAVILLWVVACSTDKPVEPDPAYPNTQALTLSYRIQNPLNREIPVSSVSLFLPLAQTSYQKLLQVSVSGTLDAEHRQIRDGLDNNILYLRLANVPVGYAADMRITLQLGLSETGNNITLPNKFNDLRLVAENERSIQPVTISFTEQDSAEDKINKLLATLAEQTLANAPESDTQQTDTAEPVAQHNGCTAQTGDLVQLARFNNIPARRIMGLQLSTQHQLRCWAELHINDVWHIVNLTANKHAENVSDYVALRIIESNTAIAASELQQLMHQSNGVRVMLGG